MKNNKRVLFCPGFREDLDSTNDSRNYPALISSIKDIGYDVDFVQIDWHRTTQDQWASQLMGGYKKCDPKNTILSGFSFGAIAAMLAAEVIEPAELWLFSLSPYSSETVTDKDMPDRWLQVIGKKRTNFFAKMSLSQTASKINCRTLLLYGEDELSQHPVFDKSKNIAVSSFRKCELAIVEGVGHNATNPRYIRRIKEMIA